MAKVEADVRYPVVEAPMVEAEAEYPAVMAKTEAEVEYSAAMANVVMVEAEGELTPATAWDRTKGQRTAWYCER